VLNIFTALLGIISFCALAGAVTKMMLSPKKVWDEDHWTPEQIESPENYNQLREGKPHIWMD
jgi:hypothetical protein